MQVKWLRPARSGKRIKLGDMANKEEENLVSFIKENSYNIR
jgi:hypothetical protein